MEPNMIGMVELLQLQEQIAVLCERVAVLESQQRMRGYLIPQLPAPHYYNHQPGLTWASPPGAAGTRAV